MHGTPESPQNVSIQDRCAGSYCQQQKRTPACDNNTELYTGFSVKERHDCDWHWKHFSQKWDCGIFIMQIHCNPTKFKKNCPLFSHQNLEKILYVMKEKSQIDPWGQLLTYLWFVCIMVNAKKFGGLASGGLIWHLSHLSLHSRNNARYIILFCSNLDGNISRGFSFSVISIQSKLFFYKFLLFIITQATPGSNFIGWLQHEKKLSTTKLCLPE